MLSIEHLVTFPGGATANGDLDQVVKILDANPGCIDSLGHVSLCATIDLSIRSIFTSSSCSLCRAGTLPLCCAVSFWCTVPCCIFLLRCVSLHMLCCAQATSFARCSAVCMEANQTCVHVCACCIWCGQGGWSALHIASFQQHVPIVKLLLDRHASVDIRRDVRC